ncbi:AMP-binding protein [Phenylobacterium sp.]|uniref:AMP-binding protein n=1 Tax=Phenylobacterium sp. TaxID=1871053 RepID=UPI002F4197D9
MTEDLSRFLPEAQAAGASGMTQAVWARVQPDAVQIYDPNGGVRTWGQVNAAANRIVRLLRARGLQPGDAVALVCGNRAEYVEVLAATLRGGFRITPVNWRLTAAELAYIIDNCEAKALFAETAVPAVAPAAAGCPRLAVKVAIGAPAPGFLDYQPALDDLDGSDIPDPVLGQTMLYTSGTTGRPKGVLRPNAVQHAVIAALNLAHYQPGRSVQLGAGPAYHAAPLAFDVRASMNNGAPLAFLNRWDSELVLKTIHQRRISHMHLVPIMFQRLLVLPDAVKAKYDLSSLRYVVHGAAPCPPEVKRAMIEWLGPILYEYYSASEGGAAFVITSEAWLKKPGSVGRRPPPPPRVRILDEDGRDLPNGQRGGVFYELPPQGMCYFKDPEKTRASRRDGFFTTGDVGYFDEDDYLFLTGRSAEVIISGGVNIYPQEIDNEILKHPAVADCATVGVPDAEWGEAVKAVVELSDGYEPSPALAGEILAFVRGGLAGFKVPRTLDFARDLPRTEAGKVLRSQLRARYWEGRDRAI